MIALDESDVRLRQFQACLNRPEILPHRAFRREDPNYVLVSYINNITGLVLSLNFDDVPNFISRASEHMVEFPARTPRCENYYGVVSDYLSHIVFHINSFVSADSSFDEKRTSSIVMTGGPKTAPLLNQDA